MSAQPVPAVSAVILDNDSVLLVRRGEEPGETLRDALVQKTKSGVPRLRFSF
jgi:ADP-ribose pyrophosphatase YjhB (NUDIX family)